MHRILFCLTSFASRKVYLSKMFICMMSLYARSPQDLPKSLYCFDCKKLVSLNPIWTAIHQLEGIHTVSLIDKCLFQRKQAYLYIMVKLISTYFIATKLSPKKRSWASLNVTSTWSFVVRIIYCRITCLRSCMQITPL